MMYSPVIHNSRFLKSRFKYHKPIEIFVDKFNDTKVPDGTIRIIILQEPKEQWLIDKVQNKRYSDCYSYVFTYYQDIVSVNKKAVYFLCAESWIRDFDNFEKKFGVSTLVGGKARDIMDGYKVRHSLWRRQDEIIIPKDFYLSSACKFEEADYNKCLVLPTEPCHKSLMFNTEYHIAIENTMLYSAFSEKLLDCFRTKTIPIHYGTYSISDYFNSDGIFSVNSTDDIINVCNTLVPGIYTDKLDAIEDNYLKAASYLSRTEILDKKLKEVLVQGEYE